MKNQNQKQGLELDYCIHDDLLLDKMKESFKNSQIQENIVSSV